MGKCVICSSHVCFKSLKLEWLRGSFNLLDDGVTLPSDISEARSTQSAREAQVQCNEKCERQTSEALMHVKGRADNMPTTFQCSVRQSPY